MFKDPVYFATIGLARSMFAFEGLRFRVKGAENIPAQGGAVIPINHTGYLDFVYAGLPVREEKRYIRYMAKSEIFDNKIAGPLMRTYKHIPVDRIDGKASYDNAVDSLRSGELVGIFPEATISRSFEIKELRSGAVRLAQEAQVPLIPIVMVGSQRVWTKGHKRSLGRHKIPIDITVLPAWIPTGDPKENTQKLHDQMQETLDQMWPDYLATYGPAQPNGEYWIPAKYGGGAPTLEQASVEDYAVSAERKRVKKLKEDIDKVAVDTDQLAQKLAENTASAVSAVQNGPGPANNVVSEQDSEKESASIGALQSSLEAIQLTINNLSQEAAESAKEGANKISAAISGLSESATQLGRFLSSPQKVADWAGDELEYAAAQVLGETKLVRDRLPNRVEERMPEAPEVLMVNLPYALLDKEGDLSEANLVALQELIQDGTKIVLLSTHNDAKLERTLEVIKPILGEDVEVIRSFKKDRVGKTLEEASALLARNNTGWDKTAVIAAKRSEKDLVRAAHRGIAVANADPEIIRNAPWMTGSFDKSGVAEVFSDLYKPRFEELEAAHKAALKTPEKKSGGQAGSTGHEEASSGR